MQYEEAPVLTYVKDIRISCCVYQIIIPTVSCLVVPPSTSRDNTRRATSWALHFTTFLSC